MKKYYEMFYYSSIQLVIRSNFTYLLKLGDTEQFVFGCGIHVIRLASIFCENGNV